MRTLNIHHDIIIAKTWNSSSFSGNLVEYDTCGAVSENIGDEILDKQLRSEDIKYFK
ncbi:1603_t:CDS:2 [Entrophospora sp. SA101]|nr:1603_t:CDS:2 [Entrophospora sp. SA101]